MGVMGEGMTIRGRWRARYWNRATGELVRSTGWSHNSLTDAGRNRWLDHIVAADPPPSSETLSSSSKLQLRDSGGTVVQTMSGTSGGPTVTTPGGDAQLHMQWEDDSNAEYTPDEVRPLFPDDVEFAQKASLGWSKKESWQTLTVDMEMTVTPNQQLTQEGAELITQQLAGIAGTSFGEEDVSFVVRDSLQGDCTSGGSQVVSLNPDSGFPQRKTVDGTERAVWEFTSDAQNTNTWACYRIENGGGTLLRGGDWVGDSPGSQPDTENWTVEYRLSLNG